MAATLPIKKSDSIFEEVEKMRNHIMKRAYELFEGRGFEFGRDLDDWLAAEREFVWAPPIEVEEGDNEITVKLSAPGVEAKDLDVELTAEDLLVEAERHEEHEKKKGKARTREMRTAKLFRSVHLPKRIDPDSAKAEFKDGMLKLTAKVVGAEEPQAR
jgi:HSP20 family molecular chaperone IbpA